MQDDPVQTLRRMLDERSGDSRDVGRAWGYDPDVQQKVQAEADALRWAIDRPSVDDVVAAVMKRQHAASGVAVFLDETILRAIFEPKVQP